MKPLRLAVAALLAIGFARVAIADSPAPQAEAGTTLIGQRDAAVGLYLLPWKEEAPSDIDRPPRRFDAGGAAVDPSQFAARVAADDANAAYRRVRLEPE
ncbi:MAG TPA: hypothetical protein VFM56_11175 [Solimonas sp.]|jgi:hypothetical protein|nr:hypothetical protein [Solimonas sp.]